MPPRAPGGEGNPLPPASLRRSSLAGLRPGATLRAWVAPAIVIIPLVVYGIWANHRALFDPYAIGPDNRFTRGHFLAAALADAQIRAHGRFSTTDDLLAWPAHAGFHVLLWPIQLLAVVVGPRLAVNLAFALTPAFNAGSCWLLGRRLGLTLSGAAALAGIAAWSPWVRETWMNAQLEQAVTGVVALCWAAAVGAVRQPSVGRVLLSGVAVWAAGMTAPHLCLAASLGIGVWAAWELVSGPGRRGLAWRWGLVLGATGLALLAVNRYQSANFSPEGKIFAPKGTNPGADTSPWAIDHTTFSSLFLPPGPVPPQITVFHPMWLGWVVAVGALVALVATVVRVARGGPARDLAPLVVGGALTWLSLGTTIGVGGTNLPGPFLLLGRLVPEIAQSGSAYRMVSGAAVALAVATAMLVRGPWTAAGLVLAAWVETTLAGTRPLPLAPMEYPLDPVSAPFTHGTGPILDLPLVGPQCREADNHYVFEAARRLRPVPILPWGEHVYSSLPAMPAEVTAAASGPDCGGTLASVIPGWGFTGVVLHDHGGCPIPPGLEACLVAAFGEGEAARGMRWWDPLPAPRDGSAAGSRIRFR